MYSAELTDVMGHAQHLLWMLARYDVEGLTDQRRQVLRRLREVETRASELGVPDLYMQILQNEAPKFIQSSYEEG